MKKMKKFIKLSLVGLIGLSGLSAETSFATLYNASADFDAAHNPTSSGYWSYGYSSALNGSFSLFDAIDGSSGWELPGTPYPNVGYFATAFTSWEANVPAGSLTMAPGVNYSIVRWTAPLAGRYSVSGAFIGVYPSTTMDVHLIVGGVSGFDGGNVGQNSQPFSVVVDLLAGQTIDFIGGDGGNGWEWDRTILDAQITAVPEPSTIIAGVLLAVPFGMQGIRSLRNRKK